MTNDSTIDKTNQPNEAPPDVDWTAFRYLAGELSESEVARFEQRLAGDQTAREAVAAAVELCQTLDQALAAEAVAPLPARGARAGRRREVWLPLGLAVGLTVLLMFMANRGAVPVGSARPARGSAEVPALATSWASARSQYAASVPDLIGDSELVESDWEDPMLGGLALSDVDPAGEELAAPSWMLAAVASLDGHADWEN